jgi:hypothetical protein
MWPPAMPVFQWHCGTPCHIKHENWKWLWSQDDNHFMTIICTFNTISTVYPPWMFIAVIIWFVKQCFCSPFQDQRHQRNCLCCLDWESEPTEKSGSLWKLTPACCGVGVSKAMRCPMHNVVKQVGRKEWTFSKLSLLLLIDSWWRFNVDESNNIRYFYEDPTCVWTCLVC